MTWPAGGAGIPNYNGSSAWGTSYTTTGSGTVVALQTSPAFVTSVTGGASFDVFNTTSTTINAFGAATTLTLGAGATSLTEFGTTAATTLNIGSGATTTGLTKAINLGSNGATGSTSNINIGTSLVGTGTITLGTVTTGTTNIAGPFQLAGTGVTTTGTKLNYLTSAAGTTGTASTNIVFSTSPVLTTPNIGAAIGTSLDASGVLESGANSGTGGQLTMFGSTSGSVALRVNAAAGTGTIFELPATNGSNTNILQTNGSGITSWVAAPTGGVNWDAIGDPSGNGSIAMGSTVQTMDWATSTTTNPLSLTAAALTTGELLNITSNSLTSGTLIDITSNGTAALTGQKGLNISLQGANSTGAQTTYGAYLSNTHSGTSVNVGLYSTATGGSTNLGLNVDGGQTLLGGTTLSTGTLAKLNIVSAMSSSGLTTAIAGIHGSYTFTNGGSASYLQVGNRFDFSNAPTVNSNTMVGEYMRITDNTSLANLVRGIDVSANVGSNTAGTSTGIRASGATFGVQGITTGLAGGVSVPAALYGENTGTTNGDVLRLVSSSVTSAPSFASFYQDTSTFTGTGLLMNFATGSGAFNGNYIDLRNNTTTVFKVTNAGLTSTALGSTASTNAVCSSLANTTAPTAKVAYELRDCNAAPAADYAEMYPVENDVTFGDIVAVGDKTAMTYDTTDGNIDWNKEKGRVSILVKSDTPYQTGTIGIVSDNYGDFSSTGNNIKDADHPMPVALSGRVPVKISNNSEEINFGDYLTTSTDAGMATKATRPGFAIGKALEDWNPNTGKDTVMVFIEEGYYNGPEPVGEVLDGLTSFGSDTQFTSSVTFNGQVEFILPPLFNSDTAGFAVIKQGTNKVDITFDTPYIAQPIVSTSISFESGDNMTDEQAQQFLDENISSIITNKSQNGFTIIINKNAPRDIRFSWTAFAVKDAKIFESIVPGLIINNPTPTPPDTTPTPEISPAPDTTPTPDVTPTPDTTPTPEIIPVTDQTPTPEIIPEPTTPESTPTSEPTQDSVVTPDSTLTPDPTPIPDSSTSVLESTPASDSSAQ
jgi:hypothetical protein